jgi:hypothetical protein
VRDGRPLAALRPEQANQHGRFYPAYGGRGAVLLLDAIPGPDILARRADPHAAEVLLRHGIPAGPVAPLVGSGLIRGATALLALR